MQKNCKIIVPRSDVSDTRAAINTQRAATVVVTEGERVAGLGGRLAPQRSAYIFPIEPLFFAPRGIIISSFDNNSKVRL